MTPPIPYKTVTGRYVGPDGSVVAGTLRFIPSTTVYDVSGNVIVPATPIFVALDGTGSFSVNLAVTDSGTTAPPGWVWQLSELIPNGTESTFPVPSASPASVPLTALTSTVGMTTTPNYSYVSTAMLAALDSRVASLETEATASYHGVHPFLFY